MRIGELAHQAGVDVQTVRYYEREGLLAAPSRTQSGYRAYGPEHLERLNFVRHCRSLDMPLAERRIRWQAAWAAIAGASPEGWGQDFLRALAPEALERMPMAGTA